MGISGYTVRPRHPTSSTSVTTSSGARRTLSLGVEREVAGWWLATDIQTVGERFNNAADVTYQQVADYATPGRILYVGLQWQPQR